MILDVTSGEKPTIDIARRSKPSKTISLIPLIDVAMFLLIFFMVAGTIEKLEIIPVAPPEAESGKLIDEGHIIILMGKHEEIVLDEELVSMDQVESFIRMKLEANPNKIITLKADATIPAVNMIQVMDRIRAAGGQNLSVMTQSNFKDTRNVRRR